MILGDSSKENKYYFRTDRGYGLMSELCQGDESTFGITYVGVNSENDTIYHRFFEALQDKVKTYEEIVKIPDMVDLGEEASEDSEDFQIVGRFSLEKIDNEILELRFGSESYSLKIHPIKRR